MEQTATLGARIRHLRTAKGWSQDRLAREMKMTKQAVWEIEGGRVDPRITTVERAASALGVSVSELMGEGAA